MGKSFGARTAGHNNFPTPYSMTEQLFKKEKFNFKKTVLEPASGDGHMVTVLKRHFSIVHFSDIRPPHNTDFYDITQEYDYIITNPPYGKEIDKFVIHAKRITRKKFAFLTRTNFLSGSQRFKNGIYDGLKRIHVFTRMPELSPIINRKQKNGSIIQIQNPIREDGKYRTAMIVYAWMIWEKGYHGLPKVDWIDNQRFVLTTEDLK